MGMNDEIENLVPDQEVDEQDVLEQEENAESIAIQRYAFNAFRIERSIRDILNWVEKGKIIVPEFQRDFVWNFNQSSRFIESILLGLPIPDFFMFRLIDNQEKSEKYILIDGLQRYTTIKQYVDGRFVQGSTNRPFKINNKASQWYLKSYEKLSDVDKDYFQDYSLKINVFDSVENSERMQKLYMTAIFERINTGSTKLSAQEVRNAIYASDIVTQIKIDASAKLFLDLLQKDKSKYLQRCKNEEFYIRLLAYYQVYSQIKNGKACFIESDQESKITSSKDLMLCNFLYYCNKKHIDYLELNKRLVEVLNIILEFSPNAFCTVKRDSDVISDRVHEVFSEALVIAMLDGASINITSDVFDAYKIALWRDQETYISFFHETTDLDHVKERVEIMKKILSGAL